MARPHLEGPLDRPPPWRRLALPGFGRGIGVRVLSVDPGSGAASLWLRYARGCTLPGGYSDSDLELYVVGGAVELGERRHGPGSYLRVPRGVALPPLRAPRGALALAFYDDGPPSFTASDSDHPRAERDRLVELDTAELDWAHATRYPAPVPGRLVKVLRDDPQSRALTCLVALAPQFRHDAVSFHDCATESVVLAGGCWSLQAGERRAGSYAWRPPYVNHGPTSSARGALLLVRSDAECIEHAHANPASTPAENRAAAIQRLGRTRPGLVRAPAGARAPRRRRG